MTRHVLLFASVLFVACVQLAHSAAPATQPARPEQQLVIAAYKGDVARVESLLKAGVSVNARYGNGDRDALRNRRGGWAMSMRWFTPLIAVADSDWIDEPTRVRIAKLLIDAGTELNLNDGYGATALHEAVYRGHEQLALLLLSQPNIEPNTRVDIYIDGTHNDTPLHRAAGQPRVVKALLARGARTEVYDSTGRTPLDWALRELDVESVKLLLDAGAWVHDDDEVRLPWREEDKPKSQQIETLLAEARARQKRSQ